MTDSSATRIDDEIFEHTMKTFPELSDNAYEKLIKLDEEWLKSVERKQRWRVFIESLRVAHSDMSSLSDGFYGSSVAMRRRSKITILDRWFGRTRRKSIARRTRFLVCRPLRHVEP